VHQKEERPGDGDSWPETEQNADCSSRVPPSGPDLNSEDLRRLAERWITPELALAAGLRRVASAEGQEAVGRDRENCAGVLIPYMLPGEGANGYYRLRRDNPPVEIRAGNVVREKGKYLAPPNRGNHLYFPPGATPEDLKNVGLPIVLAEGEFKSMALQRLALHGVTTPRFLPIGLSGVWSWRGTIGKRNGAGGERQGIKGVIADMDRITWTGRGVVIAFDSDLKQNQAVQAARYALSKELRERGAIVGYLEWPASEGKGVDDRLAAVGADRVLADLAAVDFNRTTGWRAALLCTTSGKPKALLENARIALERAPEFEGLLAFDEFRGHTRAVHTAPWGGSESGWPWTDHDDRELACWLQRHGIEVSGEIAGAAAELVARSHRVHEVRDWLEVLVWDGTERVDAWPFTYLNAASGSDTPQQRDYVSAVGRRWLIGAVARAYRPGCQVDHVLILEGRQGIGKSRGCRALGGPWFREFIAGDLRKKDSALQLVGAWILEFSELDALNRVEQTEVKSFVSRPVDAYRVPYGKRTVDVPRCCAFVGTTNSTEYLQDASGGRRFWPIKCGGVVDYDGLERDREQLWAEVVHLYKNGERWWLDDAAVLTTAGDEQDARYQADSWESVIEKKLLDRASVTVAEVLREILDLPISAWTRSAETRIGNALRRLGWDSRQARVGGKRARIYERKEFS
jgi:predicted P-loop ATPase